MVLFKFHVWQPFFVSAYLFKYGLLLQLLTRKEPGSQAALLGFCALVTRQTGHV